MTLNQRNTWILYVAKYDTWKIPPKETKCQLKHSKLDYGKCKMPKSILIGIKFLREKVCFSTNPRLNDFTIDAMHVTLI